MNEKYETIISAMAIYYEDRPDEIASPLELAASACDAFGLFVPGSYRIPRWVLKAAEMIFAIEEEGRRATTSD